jgi:tetratricopeptide (TPR) repeat protein
MNTTTRAPKDQKGEKKKFSEKLDGFIRGQRVVILSVFAVIVAAVIVLAVYSAVTSTQATASTLKVEQLSSDFSAWASLEDAAKKAEAEKSLTGGLEGLIKKWPKQFASARAYSILARMAEMNKDWSKSEQAWLSIYKGFPKTYLAPIALQNAAVAAEERGANDVAVKHYQLVVDKYTGKAVGVPHALFAIGRLSEDSKDFAAALASYEKLVASYPDDDWTKLAKDRIIALKAHGTGK